MMVRGLSPRWLPVLAGVLLVGTSSPARSAPDEAARSAPPALVGRGASGDAVTPLHVKVAIDSLPKVGVEATVTCDVTADQDSPGTTATLELPANARSVGGDLTWSGDVAAGETISFSAKIVFDRPGDSAVHARVLRRIDARNVWGDLAAIYLSVGLSRTEAGFAPVPRQLGIHNGGLQRSGDGQLVGMTSSPRQDESSVPPPPGHEPLAPATAPSAGEPCPPVDAKPGATDQQPPCGNFAPPPSSSGSATEPPSDGDSAESPTGSLTVTGNWSYYDRNDVYTGAEEFLVELVQGDNGAHLAWCYTDLSGNYSCGPVTNPGGVGVRTLLYSWSNYNPNPDTLAVVNPDWGTTNSTANSFRTQTGVVVFADGTRDIGAWYVFNGDTYERAYWTQRDINDEWRYVFFNGGVGTAGPTTVQWKIDSTDGTYYNPGGNVHLAGDDPLSQEGVVVKHEYGHNIMYTAYGNYMPPNPNCNPHTIQNAYSAGCGWTEGWADFIPTVVNNDPTFYWPSGASLDLEYPTWGTYGWDNGDWVEGRIAGALWDIYDTNNDGDDTYSDGTFANIWDVVYYANSDVFSQWWASWLGRGHSNVSWGPIMDLYQNTINYRSGPANDDFNSAQPIGAVPFIVAGLNTTNATTQGADPPTTCGSTTYPRQARSVWYAYTPPITGTYNVNTVGSGYDTVLSVWSGSFGSLTSQACDDDSGGSLTSSLDVTLYGGTTYYVEAMGYGASSGGLLDLSVSLLAPPNDDFNSALPDSGSYSDYENTTNATTAVDDPSFTCGAFFSGQGYHSVWYDFAPTVSGTLDVSTLGSSYDTVLGVFTGARGALSLASCNDDAASTVQSELQMEVAAGTTYHVEALAYGSSAGALDFGSAFAPRTLAGFGTETCEGLKAAVQVDLDAASLTSSSVDYTTVNGSATAGTDYVAASGTVTLPAGATKLPLLIQTLDDGATSGPKTFTVMFSNPVNAVLSTTSVTVTIDDNTTCLFFDGLESGNTSAWSGVAP